jgi:hypothetical protein
MPTVDRQSSPFIGTSRSFTALPRKPGSWSTCRHCSSTLYPQRLESRKLRVIGGSKMAVDKFRCRCGRGREIRRELAA